MKKKVAEVVPWNRDNSWSAIKCLWSVATEEVRWFTRGGRWSNNPYDAYLMAHKDEIAENFERARRSLKRGSRAKRKKKFGI